MSLTFIPRVSLRDVPVLMQVGRGVWAYERHKRTASLSGLVSWFEPPASPARDLDVDRAVWLVSGVLRRVYAHRFCLPRSLLLYRLLRGAGLPVRLHLGVRHSGEALDGHAWIDLAGTPVGEVQDPRLSFATTFSFPAAPSEEHVA